MAKPKDDQPKKPGPKPGTPKTPDRPKTPDERKADRDEAGTKPLHR